MLCFAGVDGSGKSTLAGRVALYLRARGLRVVVVWMRGTHTFASVLARFLARFSSFRGPCNPYYGICVPRGMRGLWLWVEFVSVLPVVVARLVFRGLFGGVVVAERSLLDFLVWLVVTLRWGGAVGSFVGRSAVSLHLSLCDRSVYVRADPGVLLSRRRGSPEERLIPLQLRVYDAVARAVGVPVVDTSRAAVDESFRRVLGVLGVGRG